MDNIHDFYNKMEKGNIMLSFKGEVTSDLLTSILQIMESKMETLEEPPKIKKKVYNIFFPQIFLEFLFHITAFSEILSYFNILYIDVLLNF